STRDARDAGPYPANTAAISIVTAANAIDRESFGFVWKRNDCTRRDAASAAGSPIAIPAADITRTSRITIQIIRRRPPQRHPDADFVRPPSDFVRHHAVQPDAGDQHREHG